MFKDALILISKLVWRTQIRYPLLFSAAILAATYAYLYKITPRVPRPPPPPPPPSLDTEESSNESILCSSFEQESSSSSESISKCESVSDTDFTDSSWMDEGREIDIELARRSHYFD